MNKQTDIASVCSLLYLCNKIWVLLKLAPTSTQFHLPPPSSTQLHPPPPSSFQPPPCSLQHPQQYLNQNIARNWGISPNLDQKLKVVHFD